MPKERTIRQYAIMLLEDKGFTCWYPFKSKFKKEVDIFGVFDCICFKGHYFKFIQITTSPNLAARRKKVQEFIQRSGFGGWSEVWAWDKKKRYFKMEIVKRFEKKLK